jgi:hypothetical protein
VQSAAVRQPPVPPEVLELPEVLVPVVPEELLDVLDVPAVALLLVVPEVPPVEVPVEDEVPELEVLVTRGAWPELHATHHTSADDAIHPVTPRMATCLPNVLRWTEAFATRPRACQGKARTG